MDAQKKRLKAMTMNMIGMGPTGGLEMNFAIGREKANNISRAETSYEGLELAISETEPSPPTGGTKTSNNPYNTVC